MFASELRYFPQDLLREVQCSETQLQGAARDVTTEGTLGLQGHL